MTEFAKGKYLGELLERLLFQYPGMRIGQIMSNLCPRDETELFYISDDELIRRAQLVLGQGWGGLK